MELSQKIQYICIWFAHRQRFWQYNCWGTWLRKNSTCFRMSDSPHHFSMPCQMIAESVCCCCKKCLLYLIAFRMWVTGGFSLNFILLCNLHCYIFSRIIARLSLLMSFFSCVCFHQFYILTCDREGFST